MRVYRVACTPRLPVEVLKEITDKPTIAVLPFTNLSGDPTQDYFSDGVTEDLITGLAKVSGLFVIARNSVFTYKGKSVKVSDVGRDLGVRFVVEGSIQRAGDRVRIKLLRGYRTANPREMVIEAELRPSPL